MNENIPIGGDIPLEEKVRKLKELSDEDQLSLALIAMKKLKEKGIDSTKEMVFAKAYELYSLNNKGYS